MTNEELENLERLTSRASPGPWTADREFGWVTQRDDIVIFEPGSGPDFNLEECDNNLRFVAASRTAVPALIAEIKRLRTLVHEQELFGLGAVIFAEVERLRAVESIVRGMVSSDLTVQHPGSNAVKRLVELLGEVEK